MAAILGLNPWKSRYQVYLDKRGEAADEAENDLMKWGKLIEPTLRQYYSNETGRAIRTPDKILYHKDHPILFANPDGLTDDLRVVELKTAFYSKDWGQAGSNEIPDSYAIQVQHYMCVTGFKVADVVVTIGGKYPVMYEVPADEEMQAMLIEEGLRFWEQVVSGIAPDPVSFTDAVIKYGLSSAVGIVYADTESIATVEVLRQVKAQIKDLEAQEDTLKTKLVVALGDNGDALVDAGGQVLCTYKMAKGRTAVDVKLLAAEAPDIYAMYLKTGAPGRRFLVK